MLTLLLSKILPARVARYVQIVAEAIEEAYVLRAKLAKTHRIGFDG